MAATVWVPSVDGGGGAADGVVWRTTADWFATDWPADGVTGAELGAADAGNDVLGGACGVIVVETDGRRSEP
ncbi:hypothetical protein ACX9NE_16110 [Mycobacterium sp. ML4]